MTRSFDVFLDLRLNKRLSKPSRHRWFETPSLSLWRHCKVWEHITGLGAEHCLSKWSLQWRHNHQPYDWFPNRLFRHRSKKTSKLRVIGLCAGNAPVTGEFPSQMASDAEKVSIWWRHNMKSEWEHMSRILWQHIKNAFTIASKHSHKAHFSKKKYYPQYAGILVWYQISFSKYVFNVVLHCQLLTEAQRYHCKYNFATASFILLSRDLFNCREFYFTAASFVLLPRDLFYCREFYFSTASFILLPRVLSYHREIYFATASFIFTTCSKIKLVVVKIKLAAAK